MTTFQPVMVKLAGERGAQLKAFAAREGLSVTEAIGAMLRAMNATDTVPGFSIECVEPSMQAYRLSFNGFEIVRTAPRWEEFANEVDRALIPATGPIVVGLPLDQEVILARGRGTTFLIKATNHKTQKIVVRALTLDLARDLAAMIRTAVGTLL